MHTYAELNGGSAKPELVRLPNGTIARVATITRVFAADAVEDCTLGIWPPRTIVIYTDGNATVIHHETLAEANACRDRIWDEIRGR